MAIFTILYDNYYPPHGEFEVICIGKFARRTSVNYTQQYGKNRQRCQQYKFTMLYGNYCYIFIENFTQKFSPCSRFINIEKNSCIIYVILDLFCSSSSNFIFVFWIYQPENLINIFFWMHCIVRWIISFWKVLTSFDARD